jgi:hypothetical protein
MRATNEASRGDWITTTISKPTASGFAPVAITPPAR